MFVLFLVASPWKYSTRLLLIQHLVSTSITRRAVGRYRRFSPSVFSPPLVLQLVQHFSLEAYLVVMQSPCFDKLITQCAS